MRTSINYSSFSDTTYYAVGKDTGKSEDLIFDTFVKAAAKFTELDKYLENKTEESVMYRIPNEAGHIQLLINKIAMLSYQGCVYQDGKSCKRCAYKNYCDIVKGVSDND